MWNAILGHNAQLERLEHDIVSENVHHAYLFTGPSQVGKTHVAKSFAAYLQSGFQDDGDVSKAIFAGSHPDTHFFSSEEGMLKVQQVREIVNMVSLTFSSRYRICIIQDVDRMNASAANCFLKILEEPPKGVIFIMTTSRFNTLLPTLVSRSRILRFDDIPRETLFRYLEGLSHLKMSVADINKLLDFADGKTGRIYHFLNDKGSFEEYLHLYQKVYVTLTEKDIVGRFSFVEDLLKGTDVDKRLMLFFQSLSHIIRSFTLDSEHSSDSQRLHNLYRSIERARRLITDTNVNKRLTLEHLMLHI